MSRDIKGDISILLSRKNNSGQNIVIEIYYVKLKARGFLPQNL